jgi:hypothetical protein
MILKKVIDTMGRRKKEFVKSTEGHVIHFEIDSCGCSHGSVAGH